MTHSVPIQRSESVASTAAEADRRTERTLWFMAIAGALASVALGIAVLVWPRATLYVGAALFGAWLLVHGVIHIVNAITAHAADGAQRALTAVLGVLFVIAGVFCLRNMLVSLLAIATIIGVTWLTGGIVGIASAFNARYPTEVRVASGILGALTVLGGLVVLFWPGPSLATLVYLTGIWLVAIGLLQVFMVLRTRPGSAQRTAQS
jgi:uncharacterized membrane protein HdeD (DUF308 family)